MGCSRGKKEGITEELWIPAKDCTGQVCETPTPKSRAVVRHACKQAAHPHVDKMQGFGLAISP